MTSDLRDNTFSGKLTLRDAAGKTHRIDAHPSDLDGATVPR